MIVESTPWSITIDAGQYRFIARGEWTLEPKFYVYSFEQDGVQAMSPARIAAYASQLLQVAAEKGWVIDFGDLSPTR